MVIVVRMVRVVGVVGVVGIVAVARVLWEVKAFQGDVVSDIVHNAVATC